MEVPQLQQSADIHEAEDFPHITVQDESENEKLDKIEPPVRNVNNWNDLNHLDSLPLMKSGYSLEADMKFGWKPQLKGKILPIPLVFDSEDHLFNLDHFHEKKKLPVVYQGWRPQDSLKLYRGILDNRNKYHGSAFNFKIPATLPIAIQKLLDQQMQEQVLGSVKEQKKLRFEGMNPDFQCPIRFDAMFESGNLDRVVMVSEKEYDLYMRPDTNTRSHHQWFYFRTIAGSNIGEVKFNVVNFTKSRSLYEYGMKVCVCSVREKERILSQNPKVDFDMAGWKRGGENIVYKSSHINRIINSQNNQQDEEEGELQYQPVFYELSFTYGYSYIEGDEVYFSYCFPYTFTKLIKFLKEIKYDQKLKNHVKDSILCHTLSGVDVPYLIVTSRANEDDHSKIVPIECEEEPTSKQKQTVVVTGRVHPGESNSSFMMEGFIRFITSNNRVARELRSRLVFKIIPFLNVDGVLVGNYRVSMAGSDLNRRYQSPHPKLHPIVCAVKKLIKEERNQILSFIDMHGHSRKKNVFMYGPEFPIHDNRYLQMRVIPKLMSEQSEMFRYYSCKFRLQRSKLKTARVVLWREFNITNCFTLESSFQGFFNHERKTNDFDTQSYMKIGDFLAKSIYEYVIMREDEEKKKIRRRVLTPSGSSEAFDDQPVQVENTKLNSIRKKLLNAQQGSAKSWMPSGSKKKKFKLTKRFKDDIPPLAPKKKKVNPNSPPDEEPPTQMTEESSDSSTRQYLTKFRMKQRTIGELCDQIKTEEKSENLEKLEEFNSSDQAEDIGDSGSECDDPLLLKLQGNILGVLTYDKTESKIVHKSIQIKEEKKQSKKQNILQVKSQEKPIVEKPVKKIAADKPSTSKNKMQISIQPARYAQFSAGKVQSQQQQLLSDDNTLWKKQRIQSFQQQPNLPPQMIQVANNNFNDRIITQQYNKHRKSGYGGTGAGYHLSTLSSNAQQLLQQQIQHDKKKKESQFSYYNFQARRENPLIGSTDVTIVGEDKAMTAQVQSLASLGGQSPIQHNSPGQLNEGPASCFIRRGRKFIPIEPVKTSQQHRELLTLSNIGQNDLYSKQNQQNNYRIHSDISTHYKLDESVGSARNQFVTFYEAGTQNPYADNKKQSPKSDFRNSIHLQVPRHSNADKISNLSQTSEEQRTLRSNIKYLKQINFDDLIPQYNASFDINMMKINDRNQNMNINRNGSNGIIQNNNNSQDENLFNNKIIVPIKTQKANKVMKLYQDVYNDLQELSRELNHDSINNRRVSQIKDQIIRSQNPKFRKK